MRNLNSFILEHLECPKLSIIERLKLNKDTKIDDSKYGISLDNFIKKYDLEFNGETRHNGETEYKVPREKPLWKIVKKNNSWKYWTESINHIESEFNIDKDEWKINMSSPDERSVSFFIQKYLFSNDPWTTISVVKFFDKDLIKMANDPDCYLEYFIENSNYILNACKISKDELQWIERVLFTWIDWFIEKCK